MFNLNSVSSLLFFSTLFGVSLQAPTREFARPLRRDVLHTTTLADGRIIDWVPIDSQADTIASAPPASNNQQNTSQPTSELQDGSVPLGPDGTVPILRLSQDSVDSGDLSFGKTLPPFGSSIKARRQNQGVHWYSSTNQNGAAIGTSGTVSMFKPYLQSSSDMSLLQTAVGRSNSKSQLQTVEAGWVNLPAVCSDVCLFTFFNTNGYSTTGDNLGGWNQFQKGWVQVDKTVFPGTQYPNSHSQIGGAQYGLQIEYLLYQGNWWLEVNGVWIGYYPASLFGDTGSTLAGQAGMIAWYGEIAQSEGPLTTTDMGSGNFAQAGWQQAAWINNANVISPSSISSAYNPDGTVVSDPNRYSLDAHWNSGTSWGSYCYLGGPGAGGVVGG